MQKEGASNNNIPNNSISGKQYYVDIDSCSNDIAIIGINGRFPCANDADEFWGNIINERECIKPFPESRRNDAEALWSYIDKQNSSVKFRNGGYLEEIDKFDYKFFKISPKEASLMDPSQRMFLEVAWGAIEDAGYYPKKLSGANLGVYVAARNIYGWSYGNLISYLEPESAAIATSGNTTAIIPSRLSYILDFRGPAVVVDTACSSSLVAVHLACQGIMNGDCELAIAGGVKIILFPVEELPRIGIESPDGRTRTFDDSSMGTGESEGVAAILLKPLKRAIEDRDNIYAVIRGSSINQDGRSIGITAPNMASQEEVIVQAWKNAGIDPEKVSYIEAHGTGTKLGDPTEVLGLKRAFERFTQRKQFCAIGSVKSNIGHLDTVAGLASIIKAALALKNRILPATINFQRPNRKIAFHKSPVYVNARTEEWKGEYPRICGVSSFGLSGTNCHVVLQEPPILRHDSDKSEKRLEVLTISASTDEGLERLIKKYNEFIKKGSFQNIRDLCFTANTCRAHLKVRLAIIFRSLQELEAEIDFLSRGSTGEYGNNIFFSFDEADMPSKEENKKQMDALEKSMTDFLGSNQEDEGSLAELCSLYVKGANIDWDRLYKDEKRYRVRIPTTQFERTRSWLKVPKIHIDRDVQVKRSYLYRMVWKAKEREKTANNISGTVLFFSDKSALCKKMIEIFRQKDLEVIEVEFGAEYAQEGNKFTITAGEECYRKIVSYISDKPISKIIYGFTLDVDNIGLTRQDLKKNLTKGADGLFNLVKAVWKIPKNIEIILLSKYSSQVSKNQKSVIPENAAFFGIGKAINAEYENLKCRCVDIDDKADAETIIQEIENISNRYHVAFRDGIRYEQYLERIELDKKENESFDIKNNGVYIITGGTGGIGLEIAKWLAQKGKAKLALINRSPIPAKSEWDHILKTRTESKLADKIEKIVEIESLGSEVICCSADVGDKSEIESVINELRGRYGKINGIFHCAGNTREGLLHKKEMGGYRDVILPKIHGTLNLHNITNEDNLDFFILFSSITSIFGAVGQGDYTAANCYLDSFASYRNSLSKRTMVINWPGWNGVGMIASRNQSSSSNIFKNISVNQGINILERIIQSGIEDVIVGEFEHGGITAKELENLPFNISGELADEICAKPADNQKENKNIDKKSSLEDVVLRGRSTNNYSDIERKIAGVWCEVLGFKELDIRDNFYEIGGDSILAVKLEVEMERNGLPISNDNIANNPTIEKMALLFESGENENKVAAEKRLQNIEPFNDLFYQSCFYNSFFPVVKSFNKSIVPILVNDLFFYKYERSEKVMKLELNISPVKDFDQIIEELGMRASIINQSSNITEDLIASISEGSAAIIWVDSYFEKLRKDTYMKKHLAHTLLVYGYSMEKKEFDILEHDNSQSKIYKKYTISFEDIENSYNGYIENFNKNNEYPTFYKFGSLNAEESEDNEEHSQIRNMELTFCLNTANNKEKLLSGINDLMLLAEDFQSLALDIESLQVCSQNLLEDLNNVCNVKKADIYRIKHIFGEKHEITELASFVHDLWDSVRLNLARYIYSDNYEPDMFKKFAGTVKEVFVCEQKLMGTIFQLIENKKRLC